MSEPKRFVVLRHQDADGVHFDLMLEIGADSPLATWKFIDAPETAVNGPLTGRRIGDHRRIYLDYEGPISGNRGHVTRHDRGTYRLRRCSDEAGAACREATFSGTRLRGDFRLRQSEGSEDRWVLSASSERRPSG